MHFTPPPARGSRWRRGAAMIAAPLLAVAGVALSAAPAHAAPEVGSSTVVPVQVTGPDSERFSLVILGDGYTAADMPKFRAQVEEHMNVLWSIEPYKSYRNNFNVYAVEIVSGESGVSCDNQLTSPRKNTPLKMAFWGGCNPKSTQRLLTVDSNLSKQYAATAPKVDQILALANSDTYGGAGGSYATASGGNAMSALITPHEIGHSLGGLQDEYDYYDRGITTGDYKGAEPTSKHHTLLTEEQMRDQQVKWWRWLGEPSESGGTIGRYEGGQYYSTGIYRPSRHSQMKTLGYAYDQVSREIMTEKISSRAPLVPKNTATDAPVAPDQVLWVETGHPVSHELDVTWAIDGETVAGTENSRRLDLAGRSLTEGQKITATIVDNTEFVRDPALRAKSSMTQSRTWTVGTGTATAGTAAPRFTGSTPTERAVGSTEVVWAETEHPNDRAFTVSWAIDGAAVANPHGTRNLDLARQNLTAGAHTLTATVTDPANPAAPGETLSWTVDNSGPTVSATITAPIATTHNGAGEPHYTVNESFAMKLVPTDDQPGYVVTEFRLDGDGWHNYYGWPTDKAGPFHFTPTGTNIDDLVYGNLGTGGMSLSPFQPREPGYGTHRVEYRAIDAAGNIGPVGAFTVTVLGGEDADPRQVILAEVSGAALGMAVDDTTPVVLDPVTLTGRDQTTTGELHPVSVIDARGTAAGWDLTGQVSDFTSGTGSILANNLGWRPTATANSGTLPTSEATSSEVVPGGTAEPGRGLGLPRTLCGASEGRSGGTFQCGGGLDLGIPGSTGQGTFTGVLTLTLL